MNTASLVPLDIIISDIAKKSGDPDFSFEGKGSYIALIQEAMQELSIDTLYLELHKDIELNNCLEIPMPSGAFNLREVYGYSGTDCNPQNSKPIYWKRRYKRNISSDTWGNNGDPYHKNRGESNPPGNLYFCGISNGIIYLSPSCKNFEKVQLRYNGLMGDIDETPIIPIIFRQAIVDYCVVQAITTRIVVNPTHQALSAWQFAYSVHEARLNKLYTGSWDTARHRAKTMDSKSRNDLKEYFSNIIK